MRKQIRYAHGIEDNGESIIIIRRRRRYSVDEWIAERPANRQRLLQSDRRYWALLPRMRAAEWKNNSCSIEK
jgi:hypothetical protein